MGKLLYSLGIMKKVIKGSSAFSAVPVQKREEFISARRMGLGQR
jgi:hypothetical protein